jgi:hypothetical protein
MKISFSLLFASLIFVSTGFSQSTSYLDSLDGKFALQFQINRDFQLSDFQGSTLSGKYHFSARDAVRLGLMVEFGDSDMETSSNLLDTINVNTSNIDNSSFGITLNTQYIRYIKATDDISFFAGGGPFISYSTTSSNGELMRKDPFEKYKRTNDSYSFGVDLLLGIEWWFHKYISLSAEYGMKFIYRSRESIAEQGVLRQETTENYFRITANSINFGITVYF